MSNENNKMQVDIDTLFKQNVNDLSAIKELYRKLQDIENKISQIKYIDSNLSNKLKKEYEKLKKIILDENVQAKLSNDIETINVKLDNEINKINTQMDNIEIKKATLQQCKEEIAKAQLEGASVDTSNFVVQSELSQVANIKSNKLDNVKWISGQLSTNDGKTVVNSSSYFYSDNYILISNKVKYIFNKQVSRLFLYDKNKTMLLYNANITEYTINNSAAIYMRVVFNTNDYLEATMYQEGKAKIKYEALPNDEILNFIKNDEDIIKKGDDTNYLNGVCWTSGKLSSTDGNTIIISSQNYHTDFIELETGDYELTQKPVTLFIFNADNTLNKYSSSSTFSISSGQKIRLVYSASIYNSVKLYSISNTIKIDYIPTKEIVTPIEECYFSSVAMFSNFGVIGDSYASGYVSSPKGNGGYHMSWGQILARMCGNRCSNYSKGGVSTRTWLTDENCYPKLLQSEPEQLYFLCLGLNDSHTDVTGVSVGNITDITNNNIENYPDTYYGNYGKIIEKVLIHAPNAKLIMCTIANKEERYIPYINAQIEIAKHYNIPLIIQKDDPFFSSEYYQNYRKDNHPVASMYAGMALAMNRLFSKCVLKYNSYFEDFVY